MSRNDPDICILLSGGIDSAAMAQLLQEQGLSIVGLFVDYGQASRLAERSAAERVASHFKLALTTIAITGGRCKGAGEISCRNATLCMLAAMERPSHAWGVAIGVHSGTPYLDCCPGFVDAVTATFALQRHKCVLLTPFLRWTKPQIIAYANDRHIPLDYTYSCENGRSSPCGLCASCRDRSLSNAGASIHVEA